MQAKCAKHNNIRHNENAVPGQQDHQLAQNGPGPFLLLYPESLAKNCEPEKYVTHWLPVIVGFVTVRDVTEQRSTEAG